MLHVQLRLSPSLVLGDLFHYYGSSKAVHLQYGDEHIDTPFRDNSILLNDNIMLIVSFIWVIDNEQWRGGHGMRHAMH